MADKREQRRKNIGFKAEGVDPEHDTVFSILGMLPRGAASDFIVMAVMEYLKTNAGQTIEGKQRRKYIVLGQNSQPLDSSDVNQGAQKKKTNTHGSCAERKGKSCQDKRIAAPPLSEDAVSTDLDKPKTNSMLDKTGTEHSGASSDAYTELDDETLASLVLGFEGPKTGD